MIAPTSSNQNDLLGVVPSATFLACSWTWCIGMYLPVFLIGDFGWPAWVSFAIPNVFGAMLVGFVHTTRASASHFAERHANAVRLFSLVTVLFHVVFLSWFLTLPLATLLSLPAWASPPAVVALLLLALALSELSFHRLCALAPIVWIASVALLVLAGATSNWQSIQAPPPLREEMMVALAWLTPALALGFMACPHLDRTFLRVCEHTPDSRRRIVFVLGFGVFFLAMIVATMLYAQGFITSRSLSHYVFAHIVLQSVFTMGAHLRELRLSGFVLARPDANARRLWIDRLALGALIVLGLSVFNSRDSDSHRFVYDLVLSMYALVFPAYVWIVAINRSRAPRQPISILIATVLLASPLFWLGAIERDWLWLTPGVGLVLVAPLVARLLPSRRSSDHALTPL
ncbi:MAG: hypothetical protein ACF8GE_07930 [Phycisphaerales bacterium JB043]